MNIVELSHLESDFKVLRSSAPQEDFTNIERASIRHRSTQVWFPVSRSHQNAAPQPCLSFETNSRSLSDVGYIHGSIDDKTRPRFSDLGCWRKINGHLSRLHGLEVFKVLAGNIVLPQLEMEKAFVR
jgi:hypothetical protein